MTFTSEVFSSLITCEEGVGFGVGAGVEVEDCVVVAAGLAGALAGAGVGLAFALAAGVGEGLAEAAGVAAVRGAVGACDGFVALKLFQFTQPVMATVLTTISDGMIFMFGIQGLLDNGF